MAKFVQYLLIILLVAIPSITYTIMAPLYPQELQRRGMSSVISGVTFSIGAFIAPILLVKCFYVKLGVFKSALVGYLLAGVSAIIFGLASKIPSNYGFAIVSLFSRGIEGFGVSIIMGAMIVLIASKFHNSQSHISAFFFGLMIAQNSGPVIGGFLFGYLGYLGVFALISVLIFLVTPLLVFLRKPEEKEEKKEENQRNLGFWDIIKQPAPLLLLIAYFFSECLFMVIEPNLPYKLRDAFDSSPEEVATYFLYFSASCLVVSFIALFVPKKTNKILIIATGTFFLAISYFLIAPSKIFSLPESEVLIKTGLALAGVSRSLITSFAIGTAIKKACQCYPGNDEKVEQITSSLSEILMAFGLLVCPNLSAVLNSAIGFESTLEIFGGISLLFAIFYLIYLGASPKCLLNKRKGPLQASAQEENSQQDLTVC